MQLEKTVCTPEQSARLQELGVTAPAILQWYNNFGNFVLAEVHGEILPALQAYSTAELGIMLPNRIITTYRESLANLPVSIPNGKMIIQVGGGVILLHDGGASVRNVYSADPCDSEAYGRAAILISMLENGETTDDDVNAILINS